MRWGKSATAVASLAVIAGLVAGCGSSTGSSASSSAASTSAGSTTAPAVSTNVPKGISLTLWVWQGMPIYTTVVHLAQKWAKEHGDTVKIVDQSKNPNGFQFYGTAARTGKGPDVLFGIPHDNNGLFAEEGLISPVPKNIFHASQYNSTVVSALTVNGKVYSIPDYDQTLALMYNKKMINTPPKTWAEFVKDANQYGFMFSQHNLYDNYGFIGGMGGYVFKESNGSLNPNDIGLNNAGAIKGWELLHNMDEKYHWMNPSTTGAIATAKFTAGQLGMTINGPWEIADLNKAKGLDYGIADLPTLPNGKHMTPFLGVITTIVNSQSKYQAADWSLAQALATPAAQMKYFEEEQQIPVSKSVLESPQIQNDKVFKAFADEIKYAVPMPNIPQMQSVWSAMAVIKDIINGKVTPTVGANDFVADIKKGEEVQSA
jgi:arabinogalactan oligomer/maltooligosaccharide transport system substrate-binding protein